jgi:hypothetical protein
MKGRAFKRTKANDSKRARQDDDEPLAPPTPPPSGSLWGGTGRTAHGTYSPPGRFSSPFRTSSSAGGAGGAEKKRSASSRGGCPPKRVQQLDMDTGEVIDEHESQRHAARKLGVTGSSGSSIGQCARGKLDHACGFRWRHVRASNTAAAAAAAAAADNEEEDEEDKDDGSVDDVAAVPPPQPQPQPEPPRPPQLPSAATAAAGTRGRAVTSDDRLALVQHIFAATVEREQRNQQHQQASDALTAALYAIVDTTALLEMHMYDTRASDDVYLAHLGVDVAALLQLYDAFEARRAREALRRSTDSGETN